MKRLKIPKGIELPVRKWPFVTNRFLHDQNVALFIKLGEVEKALSEQNLLLEKLIVEQGKQLQGAIKAPDATTRQLAAPSNQAEELPEATSAEV